MNTRYVSAAGALLLFAQSISLCIAQAPKISAERLQARKELGQLGVEYSKDSFVKQAAEGDTIAVQLFLAAGMDPNSYNKDGKTALWSAASSQFAETVQALIAGGANVNPLTASEEPALVAASRLGCLACVKTLLEHGANPNAGGPVFTAAASQPDVPGLEIIKLLVAKGAVVERGDSRLPNAFVSAASNGKAEIVRFLVEHGADVDATVGYGNTALMGAANAGKEETVRFLIQSGADVNAKTKQNDTALIFSAVRGNLEIARALLESHADVNVRSDYAKTALTIAAANNNSAFVKLLLEAGANANVWGPQKLTPLMDAVLHGNLEIVNSLLDKGADVNAKVEERINLGAHAKGELNANRYVDNWTPLMAASANGEVEILKALLDKGADVNVNAGRDSALVVASGERKLEIIQLLIRAGAKQ